MTSLTRLLIFASLCIVCGAIAAAALYLLVLVLWPALAWLASVADAVLVWMGANEKLASLGLVAVAGGVLMLIVLTEDK